MTGLYVAIGSLILIVIMLLVFIFRLMADRDKLIIDFAAERQILLDRIQARDLPEFKALQTGAVSPKPAPREKNEDLMQV